MTFLIENFSCVFCTNFSPKVLTHVVSLSPWCILHPHPGLPCGNSFYLMNWVQLPGDVFISLSLIKNYFIIFGFEMWSFLRVKLLERRRFWMVWNDGTMTSSNWYAWKAKQSSESCHLGILLRFLFAPLHFLRRLRFGCRPQSVCLCIIR